MHFDASARSKDYQKRVRAFIQQHIAPIEQGYWEQVLAQRHGGDWTQWVIPPVVEELKAKARSEGLWNLFLPDPEQLEYAPVCEEMGRSLMAPEIFNCNAPDTGNMEVLWKYGSDAQKERWLTPLLAGEIRSVFFMTEPEVASSDATNMQATAVLEGDEVVINGRKWWSSGVGATIGTRWCWCRSTRPASPSSACCRCSASLMSRTDTVKWCSAMCASPRRTLSPGWVAVSRLPRGASGRGASITACAASARLKPCLI